MYSLTQKTIKGRKYYYARLCQRVDGKPKIVETIYLGSPETMVRNARQPSPEVRQAREVRINEFGGTAALADIASRLEFVDIVDRHAPKRRQGPSIGQFMLVAAINRALAPRSKAALGDWFKQTAGPRILGVKPGELSSQAFWNHMDRLPEPVLRRIESDLLERLVGVFDVDVEALIYDATNFFTYIDTNTDCPVAQRGHNKQKRNDLRQISLGMVASADFHIPLLHMVYGGNVADSTQFGSVVDALASRFKTLTEACPGITLVFDKGNNSEANFEALPVAGMHFVGSLKLNQCPEMLDIPCEEYRALEGDGLEGVTACRRRRVVFGQERTVLITFNENLFAGQLQGVGSNIAKCRRELRELQRRLRRRATGKVSRGKKPTEESVNKNVRGILGREYMTRIFRAQVAETDGHVELRYRLDQSALARLTEVSLGKTVLFTDNHEWSDEQIVSAYRGQYHIEHAFREMKNPRFLGWNPRRHWTEQKIRVHAFYCVAALTLVSLLRRELAGKGFDLSAEKLLDALTGIRETIGVYPGSKGKKPILSFSISEMSPLQKRIHKALGLERFRHG